MSKRPLNQSKPGFPSRLRLACWERGITQIELAEKTGFSRQAISLVANGHARFPSVIEAISKELGIES